MKNRFEIIGFINKGYDGIGIGIECDVRNGFPGFDIVGLPDSAVKESRERVRTALRNCGFKFPQNRVLINLTPASTPKSGSLLDLGIALSLLFAISNKEKSSYSKSDVIKIMVAGELTLSGDVVQTAESLGAIDCARKLGCSLCLVPCEVTDNPSVLHVTNLTQAFLACGEFISTFKVPEYIYREEEHNVIFEDVLGLSKEKEELSMAVSGFHSILLFGPPGVGKTMLSKKIPYIMPLPSTSERQEINRIYGCANISTSLSISPSRLLAHDISAVQFTGGSMTKSPGEGALAHCGVLILDEANKYSSKLLQAVQSTFDCGYTQSSKSGELIKYPAKFLMVANLNPCSCGALGNPGQICTCTSQKIDSHWRHLGWQLIDRFDVRLPVCVQDVLHDRESKPDSYYIEKIKVSADRQKFRYKDVDNVSYNGQLHFNPTAFSLLRKETDLLLSLPDLPQMNTRSVFATVALARTIADYADKEEVTDEDFEKALLYRSYCHGDYYWRQIN